MFHKQSDRQPGVCVQFTYRVYDDGRRERFARVYLVDRHGGLQPGPARPEGRVGEFVAEAVAAVDADRRRVVIDERAAAHKTSNRRR